jgi:hypothetical protein
MKKNELGTTCLAVNDGQHRVLSSRGHRIRLLRARRVLGDGCNFRTTSRSRWDSVRPGEKRNQQLSSELNRGRKIQSEPLDSTRIEQRPAKIKTGKPKNRPHTLLETRTWLSACCETRAQGTHSWENERQMKNLGTMLKAELGSGEPAPAKTNMGDKADRETCFWNWGRSNNQF